MVQILHTSTIQNPGLANQYFNLRAHAYHQAGAIGFRAYGNDKDQSAELVLAIENGRVIGGMRIQTLKADDPGRLAFEEHEIFSTLKKLAPAFDHHRHHRAQCDHLVVADSHRQQGLGKRILIHGINHCKERGVDYCVMTANKGRRANTMLQQAAAECSERAVHLGQADLMTHHWQHARNTKNIYTIALSDPLREQLSRPRELLTRSLVGSLAGNISLAMPLTPPKAVLFDWDEVFCYNLPPYVSSLSHTFSEIKQKYGISPPENMRVDKPGAHSDYLAEIYKDAGEEIINEAKSIFQSHYDQTFVANSEMLENAKETIALLEKHNIPFAIISNGQHNVVKQTAKKFFGDAADHWPIYAPADKPNTAKIDEALTALGIAEEDRKHVWFVGDNIINIDVGAAVNAGLKPILFTHVQIANTRTPNDGPHAIGIVHGHTELQGLLDKVIERSQRMAAQTLA